MEVKWRRTISPDLEAQPEGLGNITVKVDTGTTPNEDGTFGTPPPTAEEGGGT